MCRMCDIKWHEFPTLGEKYACLTVPNGPTLTYIPKDRTQTYVILQVPFGSIVTAFSDESGRHVIPPGTAHFIEHKLFANEDGSDSLEILGSLGANGNAYTTPAVTCYLFSTRNRVEDALAELLRFVTTPYFTRGNVADEREIIESEIAMYEDDPGTVLYQTALSLLYRTHPVREKICGSAGSVGRITPSLLSRVYAAYYHPSDFRIFVAGRADIGELARLLSLYGKEAAFNAVREVPSAEPNGVRARHAVRRMNVHLPLFARGRRLPCDDRGVVENARRSIARDLIATVLFSKTGELYDRLYGKGLIRAPLHVTVETLPGAAHLLITGESHAPAAACREIDRAIREAKGKGLCEEDILRSRRAFYADYLISLDSTEELAEGFASLAEEGIDLFTYGTLIDGVTPEYVNEILQEDLALEDAVMAEVRPVKNTQNA